LVRVPCIGLFPPANASSPDLTEEAARAQADDMCRKLLSNPIIEDQAIETTAG
jgi:phosphoribosylformylglycinamidine (FGAM) synthase PurS component